MRYPISYIRAVTYTIVHIVQIGDDIMMNMSSRVDMAVAESVVSYTLEEMIADGIIPQWYDVDRIPVSHIIGNDRIDRYAERLGLDPASHEWQSLVARVARSLY